MIGDYGQGGLSSTHLAGMAIRGLRGHRFTFRFLVAAALAAAGVACSAVGVCRLAPRVDTSSRSP